MPKRKVILIIRDGWGYNPNKEGNLLAEAETPVTDRFMADYPNTLIKSSGEAVGLPEGYQGNSEVGHMTIGSGRIIFQSFVKINKSIESGEFFNIPDLLEAINNCRNNNSSLHIMGLLQTEAVHAHSDHMYALLELCRRENFGNVFIHVFTDGRDAPVNLAAGKVEQLQQKLKELGFGKIATVGGRYYAMDRDKRWDRTKLAYDCIVNGEAKECEDAAEEIKKRYDQNETDEFIVPFKIKGYEGVRSGDSMIFFNFRTERTRQLTRAIVEENFEGWERKPLDVFFVCMTQYYDGVKAKVAFKDEVLKNILGEVISNNGLRQLRISETEKFAHITFFFNGQKDDPFPGEERILIDSAKVATYDEKPEMKVNEIADQLVEEIKQEKYNLIVTNLVNCDIVGHTAVREAILKAVNAVDANVGKIAEAGLSHGYDSIIFADHGNAEEKTGEFATSHTKNPVPLIFVSKDMKDIRLRDGCGLADIAPTVLDLMGIEKPEEMSGISLMEK